jgi:hypothetical protein
MLLASAGLPMAICLVVLMLAPLVRLSATRLWGIDISTPR